MTNSISIRPSKDIRTNYAQISALTRDNPVAITVNGKDGVCPGTIKAYNLAAGQNKARMLAVNLHGSENSDFL